MAIFNPELHLWTIEYWNSQAAKQSGSSFVIWVSPKFLEVAKEIKYDEAEAQKRAREIVREAGFKRVVDYDKFLMFGEWGLMHLNVPGNGSGLDIEYGEDEILRRGARFLPHNVDNVYQQSALMAIWMMWANFVEGKIYQEKRKEGG